MVKLNNQLEIKQEINNLSKKFAVKWKINPRKKEIRKAFLDLCDLINDFCPGLDVIIALDKYDYCLTFKKNKQIWTASTDKNGIIIYSYSYDEMTPGTRKFSLYGDEYLPYDFVKSLELLKYEDS